MKVLQKKKSRPGGGRTKNRIVNCGGTYRIYFNGEEATIPANVPAKYLDHLIKNRGIEVSDKAFCDAIGYRPRKATPINGNNESLCFEQELTSTNFPSQVHEIITSKERKIKQEEYSYLRGEKFKLEGKIESLSQEIKQVEKKRGVLLKNFKSELVDLFGPEFGFELCALMESQLSFETLCTDDQEILQQKLTEFTNRVQPLDAKLVDLHKDREEKSRLLKETQKSCNESYVWGFKSVSIGNGDCMVPCKNTRVRDYVRKLKGRTLHYLRTKCHPPPELLIKEIQENVIRTPGITKYVGNEEWLIE